MAAPDGGHGVLLMPQEVAAAGEPQSVRRHQHMPISIDTVWARIKAAEGEVFRQIRGKEYTYVVQDALIVPEGINQNIPKSQFEKALHLLPFDGTAELQNLRGPSYIYSVLMDARIRGGDEWGSRPQQT